MLYLSGVAVQKGKATAMMGSKERHFRPLINVTLEELVPQDHFYRHLERSLDLSFVYAFVKETYAGKYSLKNNFLLFGGVSRFRRARETWSDRIVPLATHAVLLDVESLHLVIGDLLPFLKGPI